MTTDNPATVSRHRTPTRHRRRAGRATAAALGIAAATLASPALAVPPETWEAEQANPTATLLVIVGISLGLIALISLLVYLPGMIRGQSTEPALSFRENPEWFGGPRAGLEAAEGAEPAEETGGASARW